MFSAWPPPRASSRQRRTPRRGWKIRLKMAPKAAPLSLAYQPIGRHNIPWTKSGRPTGFATSASDWFWDMDENLRFFCFSERFSAVTGVLVDFPLGKTRLERGQSLRAFANLVRSTHGPIGKSSVYRVGWTSLISPPMPEICHILAYIAAMTIPLPLARHIPPGRIGKDRHLSEVIA